jgi:hypothetical protein
MNNYKIGDLTVYYNDNEKEKVTDDKTLALISKFHADKLFTMLCGKRDKFFECAKLTFAQSYTTKRPHLKIHLAITRGHKYNC